MNDSAKDIILSNSDFFSQSNFVTDYLRVLGWNGIMVLRSLTKGVESLFDAVYDFLNITNSGTFQDFYSQYRPLILAGFVISIIALGAIYMLSEKRPEVLKNFIIGLMVIFATPTFIQYLNEAIFTSKTYLTSDLSITDSVISSNMTDLLYLDENGWNFKSGTGNSLDEGSINHLDPSEHVNKKNDVSNLGREIFNTKIVVKSDGKIKSDDMGVKGWFDIFDPPYYYRYSIHFFQIPILLTIYIFVIVFASYKTFILIYEIMNSRIIGSLVAMDLTSGQKTKKVIEGFFSAYFSLFYILVSLKLYAITQAYINAQSYGPIVRTFMLVFAGFLVMDGPNLVEKIFGYDIGFGSSGQKFMSLMRLGMEGMQMKYYAQNMGMGLGNLGKSFSDLGSALNNKFSLNNSKKANAPEPPTNPNPGEKAAYTSPEPNATSNSQNYNSASTADNKPKDMPNGSGNHELNPNSEGTTGNDQILNGENGKSYSTNEEPPMSGAELNDNNSNSSELPKGDSGLENSSNENVSDMPESTFDNNELNNSESSLQESGQDTEKESQRNGYDSQNNTNVRDKESNASPGNSAHQNSIVNSPENGNENANNINNNPSYNSTEEKAPNSSAQEESNQPSNNYDQANASNNSGNESKTGTEQLTNSKDPNSHASNNKEAGKTENHTSDMGMTGATNSTGNNSNPDKQQNGHMDSTKERLMDKKFGTESTAPQIISSLPKEEPSFNPANTNTELPGTQNNAPISNTDSGEKRGETVTGSEQIGRNNSSFNPTAKENSPISSIGSHHTDRTSGQDQSNMKPISNKESEPNVSADGHFSGEERTHSGTVTADHTDSVMSKPAYQTNETASLGNTDNNSTAKENSPISSIDSHHADGTSGQDQSNMKPISNKENEPNFSADGHSSGEERTHSGTDTADYTDSVMSKPAYQTNETASLGNTGNLPIEPIGDSNSTPNGTYNTSPTIEGTGLSSEIIPSSSPIPQESSYDNSRNTGYISSESGLKMNDSLINNIETGIGKTDNSRNLNVTDMLNATNPELPKGDNGKKPSKAEESDKKSSGTRSKGVSNKKKG